MMNVLLTFVILIIRLKPGATDETLRAAGTT